MAPIEFNPIEDDYKPHVFQNTEVIKKMHNQPRFGEGDDISVLMDENASDDEQTSYVVGIFLWSLFIFLILLVWAIVLVAFKVMGKRVGFLSGTTPVIPPPPPSITDEDEEDMTNPALKLHTGHRLAAAVALCQKDFDKKMKGTQSSVKVLRRDKDAHTVSSVASLPEALTSSGSSSEERAEREPNGPIPSSSRAVIVEDATVPERSCRERNDEDAEEWRKEVMRVQRLVTRTRIIVFACGVLIITAAVLLFTQGVSSLVESLKDTNGSVQRVTEVAEEALQVTNTFLFQHSIITNVTHQFINGSLAGFCQNATNVAAVEALQSAALVLRDELEAFEEGIIISEVKELKSDLEEALEITTKMENQLTGFTWAVDIAAAFMALHILVVMGLMAGVALAWAERLKTPFRRAHSYLILPLFYFTLFLAWLFTTIFVLASIVSADICVDSPTPNVMLILENNKDRFTSFLFDLASFYISGCDNNYRVHDLDSRWSVALDALDAAHKFIWVLARHNPTELSEYCNVSVQSTALVKAAAHYIDAKFHVYLGALDGVRRVFVCSNWNPIYTGVFYDALCYNGVDGLAWIYSCEFAIVICSMIIITLRVAWHEVERDIESDGTDNVEDECAQQETESKSPQASSPPQPLEFELVDKEPAVEILCHGLHSHEASASKGEETATRDR